MTKVVNSGAPCTDFGSISSPLNPQNAPGIDIKVPKNYYPDDDPSQDPIVSWRAEGQLIYTNWLNYYVYQTTPYDLGTL